MIVDMALAGSWWTLERVSSCNGLLLSLISHVIILS
jgi:hypothetical protein